MTNKMESDRGEELTAKTTRLGLYLRRIREQRGLSIRRLAAISGVSESIISRLETGRQRTAQDDNLEALSRAFSVPVGALKDLGQRPAAPPPVELLPFLDESLEAGVGLTPLSPHQSQVVPDCITALLSLLHHEQESIRRQSARLLEQLVEEKVRCREPIDAELRQALEVAVEQEVHVNIRSKLQGILKRLDDRVGSVKPIRVQASASHPRE